MRTALPYRGVSVGGGLCPGGSLQGIPPERDPSASFPRTERHTRVKTLPSFEGGNYFRFEGKNRDGIIDVCLYCVY